MKNNFFHVTYDFSKSVVCFLFICETVYGKLPF